MTEANNDQDNRLLVTLTVTEFRILIQHWLGASETPKGPDSSATGVNLIHGIPALAGALNISLSVCKKMIAEKKIPFSKLSARKYVFDLYKVLKATATKEVSYE
jgi:hypothetical protein